MSSYSIGRNGVRSEPDHLPSNMEDGWEGNNTGRSERSAGGLIFQFRQEMIKYQTQGRNSVLRNS